MTTVAVLPIKCFERAKTRLDVPGREHVAADMVTQVLGALRAASGLDAVLVVTADPAAVARAAEHGFEVVDEPAPAGHSAAAALGVARAVARGASRVLLVPGDCPLLTGDDVDALLDRHRDPGVVVVPDRHGTGTNALLLSPPEAIGPAFGEGSRARHERLAAEAGVRCTVDEVPALLLDVDTVADLEAVRVARAA